MKTKITYKQVKDLELSGNVVVDDSTDVQISAYYGTGDLVATISVDGVATDIYTPIQTIDDELDIESSNAIQNAAVAASLFKLSNDTSVDIDALSGAITEANADISALSSISDSLLENALIRPTYVENSIKRVQREGGIGNNQNIDIYTNHPGWEISANIAKYIIDVTCPCWMKQDGTPSDNPPNFPNFKVYVIGKSDVDKYGDEVKEQIKDSNLEFFSKWLVFDSTADLIYNQIQTLVQHNYHNGTDYGPVENGIVRKYRYYLDISYGDALRLYYTEAYNAPVTIDITAIPYSKIKKPEPEPTPDPEPTEDDVDVEVDVDEVEVEP